MRKTLSRFLLACSLMGMLCSSALGQNVTGSITGVVTDPSGAVVVGATVTAQNTETGVATTAQTNEAGIYTIHFLPIGSYTLTVEAKGFSTREAGTFCSGDQPNRKD